MNSGQQSHLRLYISVQGCGGHGKTPHAWQSTVRWQPSFSRWRRITLPVLPIEIGERDDFNTCSSQTKSCVGEYFRDRITYFMTFCRMCINGGSIAYNWTTVSYLHKVIAGAVNTEREYVTFASASIEFVWLLYAQCLCYISRTNCPASAARSPRGLVQ